MSELDISIAGEINLDLILYGLPATMPTDCELLASQFQLTLGSSSAILAHNLAVLGAKVGFITRSGSDELGSIAVNRLTATGVELSRIIRTNGLTSTGLTNLLAHDQTWSIAHLSGHYGRDVDYLASATHFHLSSLFLQRSPSESAAAFSRSQALGAYDIARHQ
jgi:sugar/nucleoside kinase (ribokinase family)